MLLILKTWRTRVPRLGQFPESFDFSQGLASDIRLCLVSLYTWGFKLAS